MVAAAALDAALQAVARHLPQALLALLVGLVLVLVAKDVANGVFRRPFLRADAWQPLPLVDKKELTHNTRRFRFALPHAAQELGLPVGQHISLKVVLPGGTEVLRCGRVPPSARGRRRDVRAAAVRALTLPLLRAR